jgi:hypothetical protein
MSLARLAEARHQEIKRLWLLACKFDKIEPTAKFVQFSKKNKYAIRHNQMVGLLHETMKESTVITPAWLPSMGNKKETK